MKLKKLFQVVVLGGSALGVAHCGVKAGEPSEEEQQQQQIVTPNPDGGAPIITYPDAGNPQPDAGNPEPDAGPGGPEGW